jgi:hypothetical protein
MRTHHQFISRQSLVGMTVPERAIGMTIAHAYTLLLEAAALAASFSILWLSFWMRDRRRQHHRPAVDFASDQQDGAQVGPLVLASVRTDARLTIDLALSDVQPASQKDKAILYRPKHAQHFNDKPQIEA